MQVIENNFVSQRVTCEKCRSVFAIEDGDYHIGNYGAKYWTCPYCSKENFVDDGVTLTPQNLVFPQHFANYKSGKQMKPEELNEWAKEAAAALDKDVDYAVHACGNSIVFAYKSDPELHEVSVVVCDSGYYETFVEIPEEKF